MSDPIPARSPTPIEQLLTPADLARILRCGRNRPYDLAASGALPCVRLGASIRFRPEDVRAFLAGASPRPAPVLPLDRRAR